MIESSTAFLLGFLGSLHCAGMCGPLVLALPGTAATPTSFLAGRLVYNLGRILTYCALGLVFGLVGKTLAMAGLQRWTSIGLGCVLLIGLFSSRNLLTWNPAGTLVSTLKSGIGRLLRQRSVFALGTLGLLNGLLPCGLVYIACAGAVATGGTLSGLAYMALFGVGTVPMMLSMGLSGRLLPFSLRLKLRKAIPASVFLVATLLILRGMSLGIPYLSPNLAGSGSAPPCCH